MPQTLPTYGPHADRPLYARLVGLLRTELSGQLQGARVDSEAQLTKRFGVSRFTVAKALEILVKEGVLTRRQGLGTFIAPLTLKRAPSYLLSFSEAVAASGHVASQRLLAFGPTPWRDDLPFAESEPLIQFDRLRFVDRAPAAVHRSVLTADVAERIGLTRAVAAREDISLYRLFERAGLAVTRGLETLRARPASTDEADWLQIPQRETAVVMSVRRTTIAADDRVLDVVDAVYDARRYAYEAEMRRVANAPSLQQPTGENDNGQKTMVQNIGDSGSIGPRLGPWGELSDERS